MISKLRKQILIRDNFTCSQCNQEFKDMTNLIHIHHIDQNKNNNNLDNLKSLCIFCHHKKGNHIYKIRSKKIKITISLDVELLSYIYEQSIKNNKKFSTYLNDILREWYDYQNKNKKEVN